MYEAHCPSCGARTRIPQGQPPPRCRHCWTALTPVEELGSAPAFGGRAGGSSGGLAELLTAGMSPRAAVDPSPAGMVTCRLCGMFVDPERFCSDCGAPLPQVRVA